MGKYSALIFVALCVVVTSALALPRQYRYYPPPLPNRFAGWTVTSQELLALPSQNDPANIVRVAPPAGFLRQHHISRRSALPVNRMIFPSTAYAYLNEDDMADYYMAS